ncbi:hypothetical protein EOM81_07855 [bacterium]|nr:hypothetical protein [bacterium]
MGIYWKHCECAIGYLERTNKPFLITKKNYFDEIREFIDDDDLREADLTVYICLDGRKGYIKQFKYCPYCGKQISWEKIKRDVEALEGSKELG